MATAQIFERKLTASHRSLRSGADAVDEALKNRQLGKIAPGYGADLVILDADPTVDIGNAKRIRTVVLKGREVEREALLTVPGL